MREKAAFQNTGIDNIAFVLPCSLGEFMIVAGKKTIIQGLLCSQFNFDTFPIEKYFHAVILNSINHN